MTAEKIKKRLLECASHMCFDYNGKGCGIDPYYVPEKKKNFFNIWYGEDETCTLNNIDDVMKSKFFNGKSLEEIADIIEITEW